MKTHLYEMIEYQYEYEIYESKKMYEKSYSDEMTYEEYFSNYYSKLIYEETCSDIITYEEFFGCAFDILYLKRFYHERTGQLTRFFEPIYNHGEATVVTLQIPLNDSSVIALSEAMDCSANELSGRSFSYEDIVYYDENIIDPIMDVFHAAQQYSDYQPQ